MEKRMKQINILIVVDVVGALASKNLGDNVYLIDTNKHFGSGQEGQQELITACQDGEIIVWSVCPINPGNDVEIQSFTGGIIDKKICVPKKVETVTGETVWSGRVESQGATAKYQYSCVLSFDGAPMTFDPFLNVTA
jgi:hypothetical protein